MTNFNLSFIILAMAVLISVNAQEKWSWSKAKNQKVVGYYPSANKKVYYTENDSEDYARRDREPTTRKPLPGELPNDDIDDYADDSETPPTKQNNPYPTGGGGAFQPGFGIQPGFGAQPPLGGGGGFNRFPQFGGSGTFPGILVGPGGPTGVIGRPQAQFPPQFPQQPGYGAFPGYNTQNFVGAGNTNYSPQYQPGYPTNPHQQQFGAGATPPQYPNVPYPQYTEGYGLLPFNQAPVNGFVPNQQNFNGVAGGFPSYPPNNYPNFDEYPRKSANVKASGGNGEKKIDDKVSKNLKSL
uniref:Uncharacterized protein n=1 Tax=Musca domestica TaxID=7370 RepID=A0A1I8MCJ1_MUSDO